jgi:cytochrome c
MQIHTMKLQHSALLCTMLALASLPTHASLALVEKNACLNCHAEGKKLVGPSFNDIAAKYKDRKDANTYLSEKLTKGSSGVWGPVPMPAMPQLAADDVKTMVNWVLKRP